MEDFLQYRGYRLDTVHNSTVPNFFGVQHTHTHFRFESSNFSANSNQRSSNSTLEDLPHIHSITPAARTLYYLHAHVLFVPVFPLSSRHTPRTYEAKDGASVLAVHPRLLASGRQPASGAGGK